VKRREIITFLGGAVVWPFAAHAQKTPIPVIGYFSSRSADTEVALRTPFLKTLAEAGFVVGRNVLVEYRFAEGHHDQLRGLAVDLVGRPVSMLVATDRPSALAAKAATSTIPIVFTTGDDPVRIALVKSLRHPGSCHRRLYLHNPIRTQAARSCSRPPCEAWPDRLRGGFQQHFVATIPACYEWRDPVVEGGLMSYNTDRDEIGRQIGDYAAQILKGAKASDLPVVQSSKFVFVINVGAAKALGLNIPPALLARADELIE
jgi:ABC-type uncharacterized transport system substrate-binding protein